MCLHVHVRVSVYIVCVCYVLYVCSGPFQLYFKTLSFMLEVVCFQRFL